MVTGKAVQDRAPAGEPRPRQPHGGRLERRAQAEPEHPGALQRHGRRPRLHGVLSAYRGTETGARYRPVAPGDGVQGPERDRHHHRGALPASTASAPACYAYFRRFLGCSGSGARSTSTQEYLAYAGGGLDQGIQFNVERPLESLAEQLLITGGARCRTCSSARTSSPTPFATGSPTASSITPSRAAGPSARGWPTVGSI